jgi:hypothetical protein
LGRSGGEEGCSGATQEKSIPPCKECDEKGVTDKTAKSVNPQGIAEGDGARSGAWNG